MRFLKLRTDTQRRANGNKNITPLIVDTPRRFAKQRKEQAFCKKKCHLITGGHDSGKTRWLNRLYDHHCDIWGAKRRAAPVYLSALQPLAGWLDNDAFELWYNATVLKAIRNSEPQAIQTAPKVWANLTQQRRLALLPEYVQAQKALVFIDDAHRLTGRKAQLARECVMAAPIWIITALQENRLPPSLRSVVERREPQRTQLSTEVSYDATSILTWLIVILALMAGWWEVSLVLGGLKMLASGRRSARQD